MSLETLPIKKDHVCSEHSLDPYNTGIEQCIVCGSAVIFCKTCQAENKFAFDKDLGELVCTVCGTIDEKLSALAAAETTQSADGEKATKEDHNAGNGLFNQITPQQDWVSSINRGVAWDICDTSNVDHAGKPIVKQLKDPYHAGLFAGKFWHLEKDRLSGEKSFRFSRYDVPTLRMIKEFTEQLATYYGFDTVQKSHVEHEVKRMFSQIIMSEMVMFIGYSAIYKFKHWLSELEAQEVETNIREITPKIALKVRTRCDKELMKEAKRQIKEQQKALRQEEQEKVEVPPAT